MIYTPKDKLELNVNRKSIFLAGTIDNGKSVNWQAKAIELLADVDVDIYNPRNEHWNSNLYPVLEEPDFAHQVEWEHTGLCYADRILMNFLPDSKSPISLMELGWFANTDKLVVVCPDEFYRSGNVNFLCEKENIRVFQTLSKAIEYLKVTI